MGRAASDSGSPEITLVTSPGCHLCEMAKDTIVAVAVDHPLELRVLDLMSPVGAELARIHRMPFPPLILIDGKLHGFGRISEKKFRRALAGPVRS